MAANTLTSSLISPALEQLADFPSSHLPRGRCSGLREFLSAVPDPRDPRGVRHSLTSMLLASVAAVLAGARSLAAIGEWIADAPPGVLATVGVRPLRGRSLSFPGPADRPAPIRCALTPARRNAKHQLTSSQAQSNHQTGQQPQTSGSFVMSKATTCGNAIEPSAEAC